MTAALLPVLAALSLSWGAAAGTGGRFPPEVESFLYEELLWPALEAAEKLAAVSALSSSARALAWRQAAELRARAGDDSGARSDLERALKAAPDDSDALVALARSLRDKPAEALMLVEKAGASPEADRLAGELLLDLGDEKKAARRLERAVKARPSDLEALRALARASKDARWAPAAESAALAAPEWLRAGALRVAAEIWRDAGRPREARRALQSALAADPRDLDALYALERFNADGVAVSTQAAPASGARWQVDALTSLKDRLGDGTAIERIDRAELFVDSISRAPSWQRVPAYREAARAWRALGDEVKTKRCLIIAAHLDPSSPSTAELRWEIGERDADAAQALSSARAAVEKARFEADLPPLKAR